MEEAQRARVSTRAKWLRRRKRDEAAGPAGGRWQPWGGPPGLWVGLMARGQPPGRPCAAADGSSHMEAPSRKGQGAAEQKEGSKNKPERRQTQHGEAKGAEGQGEGRQARRGERARAKERRRAEERAETEGAERGATAEKKGERRGRTPSKEKGEGEERATVQAGTSNDTNFCAAGRWKRSKARARRPPRAGKSERQGEGERAGARAEVATETAGGSSGMGSGVDLTDVKREGHQGRGDPRSGDGDERAPRQARGHS